MGDGPPHWEGTDPVELIEHIRFTYHQPLEAELPRLSALCEGIARQWGKRLRHLVAVRRTFGALNADMISHLAREEQVLFPLICAGEFDDTVALVRERRLEHEEPVFLLGELRRLCTDYQVPDGAPNAVAELYQSLERLDADLSAHIFMEDEVLFPMLRL